MSRNLIRRPRGFTLIETLTVLSAISLLLSLSIPGLQQARTSARATDCNKRLKQLGLAIHNYADVHNTFPPGWISRRQDGEGHASTGWQSSILPYVDQAPLYNALNMVDGVYEPKDNNVDGLKTRIPGYLCPADPLTDINPLRGGWGASNFSGNFGRMPLGRWSAAEFWPGQSGPATMTNRPSFTGIFTVNSSIRFRDILDGTSNTMCIGERSVVSRSGIWPGPRSNFHESDVVSDGSFASPLNRSDSGFSSRHAGGRINILLCDGSTRTIPESIDSSPDPRRPGVLQKITARADGNPIGKF